MTQQNKKWTATYNQKGNIMLITVILVLLIAVVVGTCVKVAGTQGDFAVINRDTNNAYSLATQGIEKQVDTMTKALETQLPTIIKELSSQYVDDLTKEAYGETKVTYDVTTKKLKVDDLNTEIQNKLLEYFTNNFFDQPMTYEIQSDRQSNGAATKVVVTATEIPDETDKFQITSKAVTSDGSTIIDENTVTAVISFKVPANLKQEIKEYYDLKVYSEPLDKAIICFSDVIIKDSNKLNVSSGDMLVKGIKQDSTASTVMDADRTGGVIVKNGGQLEVTDNLYVVGNIIATNGWSDTANYAATSQITIGKDAIAHSIGIMDDYYEDSDNQQPNSHRGSNIKIDIGGNAFTDNDVFIDRWTSNCNVKVKHTIFGTSGDAFANKVQIGGKEEVDPNMSSGIFCQGESSLIEAKRMIVGGQPYIVLEANTLPLRLMESIGEPFDGVNSISDYRNGESSNILTESNEDQPYYLSDDSPLRPLVQGDKIKTDLSKSYAPARMSAIDTNAGDTIRVGVKSSTDVFAGQSYLFEFLFQGVEKPGVKKLTDLTEFKENYDELSYIREIPENYYKGSADAAKLFMTCKNYQPNTGALTHYSGIKSQCIAMRSIFYGKFAATGEATTVTFDDAIHNLNATTMPVHTWTYETPIEVCSGGDIDISKFYVDEACRPTIIVNNSGNAMTVYTSDSTKNTFVGMIISKGKVTLGKTGEALIIEGNVIVGGPEETSLTNKEIYQEEKNCGLEILGNVTIKKDFTTEENPILKMECEDRVLWRQVLVALELVCYDTKTDLAEVMGPYVSDKIEYTKGKLKYSSSSYLEVDTTDIQVRIVSEKKE